MKEKIKSPVDFWLNTVIKDNAFNVYWGEPSIVLQGSEIGNMPVSYTKK
jgi:hypothetical protein